MINQPLLIKRLSLTVAWLLTACCLHGEETLALQLEPNPLTTRNEASRTICVQSARLLRPDPDGVIVPSAETYVVIKPADGVSRIADCLEGHTVEFRTTDLGQKNRLYVLAFYHAGGNQYTLKVYQWNGDTLTPIDWKIPSSNLGKIALERNTITIENQIFGDNGKAWSITEKFKVSSGQLKLASTKRKLIPGNE